MDTNPELLQRSRELVEASRRWIDSAQDTIANSRSNLQRCYRVLREPQGTVPDKRAGI